MDKTECFLICCMTFLMGLTIGIIGTTAEWKDESVAVGKAEYYLSQNKICWRWKQ